MKKNLTFVLSLALACALSGCAGQKAPVSSVPDSQISESSSSTSASSSEESSDASTSLPEKIMVADAAMYRGTVTATEKTAEGTLVTLERATGTDFGAASSVFLFDADTRLSFTDEKLAKGAYLEVFYGVALGKAPSPDAVKKAIGANYYPSAEMVVFNGILKEILPDESKAGSGRLVMESTGENKETVEFLYSNENTQFYLTFADLKPGDKLNFLHRGAYTRSIPPQGFILEARPFADN